MSDDADHTQQLPDRYVDARLVARGGMGEVWHARDSRLDRDVAIKLLGAGDGPEDDETRRARFEREARVVARLSAHPGVITIYDVGEIDDRPYLAMEWMPGGTLADRLAAPGPIPPAELLATLEPVAAALDAAHADGVVHRDVKPGNVMFDSGGAARIGDFGIATSHLDPGMTLTQAGSVVGTAGYVAPEQAAGTGVTPASDQYALMAVAFEALTGDRPFARDGVIAEFAAHVNDPIPSVLDARHPLPSSLDAVFARGLAKDPQDRFPSCADAIQALRLALDDVPPTIATPAAAAAPRSVPRPTATRTRARTRPGTPLRVGIVAAVLLATLLVLLAANAARDDATPRPDDASTDTRATPETTPSPPATTATEPATTPEAAEPSLEQRRTDAIRRNEEAFAALEAGRFQEAFDLASAALPDLVGVSPYEAYANYNAGAALVGLGRCAEALPYLDLSERLQGQRDEIDAAREEAAACIAAGDDRPGKGKAKGKKSKDDDDGDD